MKNVLTGALKFLKSNKKNLAIVGAVAAASAVPGMVFAADATGDLLASQQTTVNSTFGHGSSLEKYFYYAEVFLSLMAYFKARTPMVFIGLLMVMLFTRIAFSIIG
jgi:type IV conjugative transfer system pilin TraA